MQPWSHPILCHSYPVLRLNNTMPLVVNELNSLTTQRQSTLKTTVSPAYITRPTFDHPSRHLLGQKGRHHFQATHQGQHLLKSNGNILIHCTLKYTSVMYKCISQVDFMRCKSSFKQRPETISRELWIKCLELFDCFVGTSNPQKQLFCEIVRYFPGVSLSS